MMDNAALLWMLGAVFAPVATGVATLLLPKAAVTTRTLGALLGPVLSVYCLLHFAIDFGVNAPTIAAHGASSLGAAIVGFDFAPAMHLSLSFNADPLGLFFALLIAGVGVLIVLYARGYFGRDEDSLFRFYPTLGLFATSMLGLVLSDNLFAMLVFWEMTSVSSFLLIGWERSDPRAVRLAVQAFLVTGLGGLALMGGFILLGLATGQWAFSGVLHAFAEGAIAQPQYLPWALALIFLGGATKSAQWPFHFWLPGAMAAPTPVSAYLHSATMVKAGVYLFARLYPGLYLLGSELPWWVVLIGFGSVTMLLGGYLALRSTELKKIFAYTTVSQLGLFVCMYGLGKYTVSHGGHDVANIIWPITQIVNHALYKAPLFIIAGAIMHIVGKKEIHQLKGLLRTHTLLALICLGGAYGLAAGPFTLSFTAKEAFLHQVVGAAELHQWIWIIGVMVILTAACNTAIFVRFLTTFSRRPEMTEESLLPSDPNMDVEADDQEHHVHTHEKGFWGACIWWPAALLVLLQFVGGVAPGLFESVIAPVETHALIWSHLPSFTESLAQPGPALTMSLIAMTLGVLIGLAPVMRRPVVDPHNKLFPAAFKGIERLGGRLFARFQNGNFRSYVYIVLTALVVGLVASASMDPRLRVWPASVHLPTMSEGVLLSALSFTALVCLTAIALPIVRSRTVRVLVLGTCGFSVTGLYLLYQAPDLALTQLMFEIISVILFLLALRMLPEEPKRWHKIDRVRRAFFGAAVGITVGWITLQVGGQADMDSSSGALGQWFTQHALNDTVGDTGRGGNGANIVNVILVDFRGYDTLGEITVLSIAAMGVFALIVAVPAVARRRQNIPGETPEDEQHFAPVGPQPSLTSPLFRTAMRVILPLSLIFAAYMFFKGHNEPGGGFIAGLVAAVSLAVYRMAEGRRALTSLLPIKPGPMLAVGLAMALLTGLTPLLLPGDLHGAFLQSYDGRIPLLGADPYHWASPMFFDIGVLLVVVAVSMGIINRLTEELE